MATVVCQRIASRKSTKFSRVRFLLDSPIANQQVSHTDQERHDVTMSSWRKMEFTGVSRVNKQPQLHFRLGCSGNCTFVSLWCDYLRAKCAKENWKIVVSLLCNLCHVAVVIFNKAIWLPCAILQHMLFDGSSSFQVAKVIWCFVYAVDPHLQHTISKCVSSDIRGVSFTHEFDLACLGLTFKWCTHCVLSIFSFLKQALSILQDNTKVCESCMVHFSCALISIDKIYSNETWLALANFR